MVTLTMVLLDSCGKNKGDSGDDIVTAGINDDPLGTFTCHHADVGTLNDLEPDAAGANLSWDFT